MKESYAVPGCQVERVVRSGSEQAVLVVRFSGISFSYNVAYAIFGGLTPMVVTLLTKTSPMDPAHYVAAVCVVGLFVALYLMSAGRSRFAAMSAL